MPRRTRTRRPDYDWDLSTFAALAQSSGAVGIELFTVGRALTLIRQRGEILTWLDATQTPGAAVQVAIGMHVVP